MSTHQIHCFKNNIKILRFLAVWPSESIYYEYYSKSFLTIFIFIYFILLTLNFYFLPRQLDIFIEEMMFYFTEISVISKALTFYLQRDKIHQIMDTIESEIFTPDSENGLGVVKKAKKAIVRYWRIVASVSILSSVIHIMSPFIAHIFLPIELELPVCSYSFLPEDIRKMLIYPIFAYQGIGMHFHMLYNVNVDTYFWGLMILTMAQLEILDGKLRNLTNETTMRKINKRQDKLANETTYVKKLNQNIVHFDEISKYGYSMLHVFFSLYKTKTKLLNFRFCSLIQDVFSVTLFIQFGMASCIICVCLFRFTLPAPVQYYIFLATYLAMMVVQIMVPCWFGTRVMESSNSLSLAVYNSDWTSRTRQFKSNLRLFVERSNRPLSITGGKMFPLSLVTFTSIMNSAYSFFTLLRHMQSRES